MDVILTGEDDMTNRCHEYVKLMAPSAVSRSEIDALQGAKMWMHIGLCCLQPAFSFKPVATSLVSCPSALCEGLTAERAPSMFLAEDVYRVCIEHREY